VKAVQIAKAAIRPVADAVNNGRPWSAKAQLARVNALIGDRISDESERQLVEKELAGTKRDLDLKIGEAIAQRDAIFQTGVTSYATAASQLDAFFAAHPDYPEVNQDKARLSQLQEEQISDTLKRHIEAIEATLQNDPKKRD
jgi:hypothetical protein